jgi:D-alanyl-D-alanine carboxypeptidase/D-alanyl-D-alanine-endopeptidase (penicillin-binding protein 4)
MIQKRPGRCSEMIRHNGFLPLLFTSLLALLLNTALQGQPARLAEDWKKDPSLRQAAIGFCVMDARSSEVVSEYNPEQFLIPASTMKVVSTSAALQLLGAGYRYETRLYFTGEFNIRDGILHGDLIILGSGDPSLQSEHLSKDKSSVTDDWARILKDKGLKEIRGQIIGDASGFDRQVPANWIWEDISNYFGAVPCGLSYRDNKFKVRFTTGEPGSKARITGYSPSYLQQSYTVTADVSCQGKEDQAYAYGDPFSFTREIRGSLPPNRSGYEIELALPDPALLCAEELYTSLIAAGIQCKQGSARSRYERTESSTPRQVVHTHYSPSLDKIIYVTNIKSNNHYSESLLMSLGKGQAAAGLKAVKSFWSQRGLDTSGLFMKDASGLGRINTLTPAFQARLLCKVYRDSSLYKAFNSSLPLAGKQGSMNSIGRGTFIENNLRAKTGYLNRARAYCGYVTTRSGRTLAFSLIFNHYNCSPREARLKMEKFMIALADL